MVFEAWLVIFGLSKLFKVVFTSNLSICLKNMRI